MDMLAGFASCSPCFAVTRGENHKSGTFMVNLAARQRGREIARHPVRVNSARFR